MRTLALLAALAAAACSPQPAAELPQSAGEDATATVVETPPDRSVTITSVRAENPVIVEGTARTFENNVVIRLLDARGDLIRQTATTAVGDPGTFNPYRAEVLVTRDPGERLTVEAVEYSAKDGSLRSRDTRTVDYGVETIPVDLYFTDRSPVDCSKVFPNRTEVPKTAGMARLLVIALMEHPRSPFPRGSDLQGVKIGNGVLTVDFNERLQNVGGSCAAQAIRASVEKTLLQLPTVERVVITAGGSEKLALQP